MTLLKSDNLYQALPHDAINVNASKNHWPTSDGDGSYIDYSAVNTVKRYSRDGTLIWSVGPTDIHADADNMESGTTYYDSTDDLIWVTAVDVATTPDTRYLATIDPADGTVTNIGSCQSDLFPAAGSHNYELHMERIGDGSGDFELLAANVDQYLRVSSTDGSLVEESDDVRMNGVPLNYGDICYVSADGLIFLCSIGISGTDVTVTLMRGGSYMSKLISYNGPLAQYGSFRYKLFGKDIVMPVHATTTAPFCMGSLSRTVFDAWLKELADDGAMPPGVKATIPAVPDMTSNSTPSPFVASSSDASANAWQAFDKTATGYYVSTDKLAGTYLGIDLGSAALCSEIRLEHYSAATATTGFKVYGSNTAVGTGGTLLHTQTGVPTDDTYAHSFRLQNPGSYRYYTIEPTAGEDATSYYLGEVQFDKEIF